MPQSIFDVATQYAFAGYAALSPLLVAALFWKGSTRWGALATHAVDGRRGGRRRGHSDDRFRRRRRASPIVVWAIGDSAIVTRGATGTLVLGLLPVVPMTLISALLMIVASLATKGFAKPSESTLARYFAP